MLYLSLVLSFHCVFAWLLGCLVIFLLKPHILYWVLTEVNKPLVSLFMFIWLAIELCSMSVVESGARDFRFLCCPDCCFSFWLQASLGMLSQWEHASCSSFGCDSLWLSWNPVSVVIRWEEGTRSLLLSLNFNLLVDLCLWAMMFTRVFPLV